MNRKPAIEVRKLGKQFRMGLKRVRYSTLRETIVKTAGSLLMKSNRATLGPRRNPSNGNDLFWALQDISFLVHPGEVVGIIGENGAGKSTLLKILARITEPTTGQCTVRGRIGSLLEVGTGFHPELTGRENIHLNGAILGLQRREIARRFDEIVDFSGVERFIDMPVKHYSSGMKIRLAFSVAAHLQAEILLVDEVLAVGDAAFQKKCLGKMGGIVSEGRTVLFVSHQLEMIRAICNRCLCLAKGRLVSDGHPGEVIDSYLSTLFEGRESCEFSGRENSDLNIQILGARVTDQYGKSEFRFDMFDPVGFEIDTIVRSKVRGVVVYFELKRNGSLLFKSFDTDTDYRRLEDRSPGRYRDFVKLPCPLLKPGLYSVTLGVSVPRGQALEKLEDVLFFEIKLNSKRSAELSYSEQRNGEIAAHLLWEQISLNTKTC